MPGSDWSWWPRGRSARCELRRQAATVIAIGAVAVVLTALSLNHLATGIEIIAHASGWEAMALAVGVDLGFVALELSQLAIGDKLRRQFGKYPKPPIISTLPASPPTNTFPFPPQ